MDWDPEEMRDLCITAEDETMKWNALKEAKNLCNARKEALKKVYMTTLEQEKDVDLRKQLLEKKKQAKEKQDQSRWIKWTEMSGRESHRAPHSSWSHMYVH